MLHSDWNTLTTCLDANDVTFDDMYQYLSSFTFYDRYYNGSVGSYRFFCSHIEGQSKQQLAPGLVYYSFWKKPNVCTPAYL